MIHSALLRKIDARVRASRLAPRVLARFFPSSREREESARRGLMFYAKPTLGSAGICIANDNE
jgi:hypothetical protein